MRRIIRRTVGTKREIGAALLVALQMISLILIGLMAPFADRPQQSAKAPSRSDVSAPKAQTEEASTAIDKADLRASAIAATKLSGGRATSVFYLATSRAASANQSELPNEATLTTDQEDYQPYTYVYITGTGFTPGETVNMIVVQLSPNPASYEPWDVVADANGSFETSWYIFSEELIGATMQVTGTGQSSSLTASATFTDASPPRGVAPVSPPTGGFGIEGDLLSNTPTSCAGFPTPTPSPCLFGPNQGDWYAGAGGTGGKVLNSDTTGTPVDPTTTFHLVDPYNSGTDDNFAGGDKVHDNPNTWNWTLNPVNKKLDINNGLIHITNDPITQHIWVMVAADRLDTSGEAYIDFEFLQNTLTTTPLVGGTGGFSSAGPNCGRTINDFIVTVELTNGGTVPNFFVSRWQAASGNTSCNPSTSYDYVDVTTPVISATPPAVFAAVNAAAVTVPNLTAFGTNTYAVNAFAEAAIDLTALLGTFDPCLTVGIKTILIKSKASQSPTANIVDFIAPQQITPPLVIGPTVDAGPDQSKCEDPSGTTSFTLTGSAQPGTYPITSTIWSCVTSCTGVTINSPNALSTGVTITGGPRTVTLRLTVTDSGTCENHVRSDDVILTVNNVTASSSSTPILCNGGSSTVTVSASGGASPYTGTGTFSRGAGTYSYTVTDANGCTATTTGDITQPSAVTADSSYPPIQCNGGSTIVTVTAGGGTGTIGGTGTFSRGAGTYSYTVTDANGCTATTTGNITQPSALTASSSNTRILCNGGSSTVTVNASGGTAPYSGTGTFSRGAGTYSYTVTDNNGCTATTTGNITQPSALTLSLQPGICSSGTNGTITATFGGGTPTYQIKVDNGAYTAATSPRTITGLAPGSHTITVKDANGCTTSDSISVASCPRFCALTQGAYGNKGGKYTYNGVKLTTTQLLQTLVPVGNDLVVGVPGVRSLRITNSTVTCLDGDNSCKLARLPANTTPASLPAFGDQILNGCSGTLKCQTNPAIPTQSSGQWQSTLLGQTITLTLNTRLDPTLPGLILPSCVSIKAKVLTALDNCGYTRTVAGLLNLANRGLAGQDTCGASLGDITDALDSVNKKFDSDGNNNCPSCQQ